MRHRYYKLDGKKPVPTDLLNAGGALSNEDNHVRWFKRKGFPVVSTVFLGLDHGWGEEPPVLFETMIFGGWFDQYQWRYYTWDEAVRGHKKAVWLMFLALPLSLFRGFKKLI